jgi:TolB-like protein
MRWTLLATLLAIASFTQAQPATQPSVLVLKFEQIDQTPGLVWLSRSIQLSLMTDINRSRFARAITLPEARSTPTTDTSVALSLAREQRADFVIVGSYLTWEDNLRITAQVIDVRKSEIIGSIKSTGDVRNLFLLQDGLVSQLRQLVAPQLVAAKPMDSQLLALPKLPPIGVVTVQMNRYEVIQPQPWQQSAANRHTNLNGPYNGYWWGGCGYFYTPYWGGGFWW